MWNWISSLLILDGKLGEGIVWKLGFLRVLRKENVCGYRVEVVVLR